MTQEEAKTLAEKEYPNETFGAEMCRQAYIKGLLQSPYGKCREALQRIIDLYPSSHEHGMANIALNDIRQTAIDALTLDSREDQDEFSNILKAVDLIRKQSGVYIWAFPITYWKEGNKEIEKQTFGWELEWPSGSVVSYREECETYEQALNEGIKAYQ